MVSRPPSFILSNSSASGKQSNGEGEAWGGEGGEVASPAAASMCQIQLRVEREVGLERG